MSKFFSNRNRSMAQRITGQEGALLLEAMLAVIILSVCLVMIIQALLTSVRGVAESAGYSRAVLAGENALSELGWSALKGIKPGQLTSEGAPNYRVLFSCRPADKIDSENILQKMDVEVAWQTGKNDKKILFSTLWAQPPG